MTILSDCIKGLNLKIPKWKRKNYQMSSEKETKMHDLGDSNKIESLVFRKGITTLTNKNFHGVNG